MTWEEEYLQTSYCRFKKHRGEPWYSVIQEDRDHVRWILENIEDLDEELGETLKWGVDHVPDRI
jgi:hypothetical protein